MTSLRLLPLLFIFLLPASADLRAQVGNEFWDVRLGPPGITGEARVMAVMGEDIYVGGSFQRAGNRQVNNIARWNTRQNRWFALGSGNLFDLGVNGEVLALTVDGDRLLVGGQFTHAGGIESGNIAIYHPSTNTWSQFAGGGAGEVGSVITSIVVKGSDVIVAGNFTAIGTLLANNIARWDGTKWNRLGFGIEGRLSTMSLLGNDLYVGGEISSAGGNAVGNIARWDGSAWSAVGTGTNGPVLAIRVSGSDLLIGGTFTTAGGVEAENIARYTPAAGTFTAIGQGVGHTDAQITPSVHTIVPIGEEIYIGGNFRRAGGDDGNARHLAHWDGVQWRAMRQQSDTAGKGVGSKNTGFAAVYTMVEYGGELYIGGRFDVAYMQTGIPVPAGDNVSEGYLASNVVRWHRSGRIWRSFADAPNGSIHALAARSDEIIVGGRFTTAGGVVSRNVASWNYRTNTWSPLGEGTDTITALAANAGWIVAGTGRRVMRWDGSQWSPLGPQLDGTVTALAIANSNFYAGTDGPQGSLYMWDGATWIKSGGGVNGAVHALLADGDGVWVGGDFSMAGSLPANNIARWDGSQWSTLGEGTNDVVRAIAPAVGALYVGGEFTMAGGASANRVAQYDVPTKRWFNLGTGLDASVRSLVVSDGTLFSAGDFVTTGGVTVRYVASFDGEVWTELGSGTSGPVEAMVADDKSIFVAGNFDLAGTTPSFGLGRWSRTVASAPVTIRSGGTALSIFPNPLKEEATIGIMLGKRSPVSLRVIDPLGRSVTQLVDEVLGSGSHELHLDASTFPSGVYMLVLHAGDDTLTRTLHIRR